MRNGFTLIELMVVIVIIGILAAIAIPKLFGVTAKAKAQEVGPAAGTWSKLQMAYIAETGTAGSFAKIGYIPPGADAATVSSSTTANFTYEAKILNGTDPLATATETEDIGPTAAWNANNRGVLNKCSNKNWTVTVSAANSLAEVGGDAMSDPECIVLTPNFVKME